MMTGHLPTVSSLSPWKSSLRPSAGTGPGQIKAPACSTMGLSAQPGGEGLMHASRQRRLQSNGRRSSTSSKDPRLYPDSVMIDGYNFASTLVISLFQEIRK
jgi:hypothetical protein